MRTFLLKKRKTFSLFYPLTLFFIISISKTVYCQEGSINNAFSLSRDIYVFQKQHINGTNTPTESRKILARMLEYFNEDNLDSLAFKLKNESVLLDTIYPHIIEKALENTIEKQAELIDKFNKNTKFSDELKAKSDAVKKTENTINKLESYKNPNITNKNISRKQLENDNLISILNTKNDSLLVNSDLIQVKIDSLKSNLTLQRFDLIEISNSINTNFKNLLNNSQFLSQNLTEINKVNYQFATELKNETENIKTINEINTDYNFGSGGGSISLKMPSEAEMIDAVATYIASRVKQETVLWFFEELRINSEKYDLINAAFPKTLKMLKTGEIFESPNMGTAWKYALSEDFITLPKNVLNSKWLEDRIPDEHKKDIEILKVANEIAVMLNNRFSYRDIISQLYINHCVEAKSKENTELANSINFLYAVSNEFYVLDNSKKVRAISFTDVEKMPHLQMQLVIELINIKYDHCIAKLDSIATKLITTENRNTINVWFGNSLMALSQFDKIMQQQNAKKEGENGNILQQFDSYNAWKLISNVVKSSYPKTNNPEINFALNRVDDSFEIYHLLSLKNYSGAVIKTVELIDSLLYSDYIQVELKNYVKTSDFKVPAKYENGKFIVSLMDLDQCFIDRRVKPNKFSKIAKKVKIGSIDVDLASLDPKLNKTSNTYILIKPEKLKDLISAKRDKKSIKRKINRLYKRMNNTKLDEIVKHCEKWDGKKSDSIIRFAYNSLAGQALISQDKKAMMVIQKLASFLNDVSLAKDEKELKKVVESYALPTGSYKQKRNAWQSLTFNAFAGAYTGYETSSNFLFKSRTDSINQFGWNYGVSVPIGLTYSKTFGKRSFANSRLSKNYTYNPDLIRIGKNNILVRSNWNLSVTLSIVDIGAVVSYRMSNKEAVLDHTLKWEQFISPGLHVGLAIPRTPLVLQMGYQYTPQIRKIKTDGTSSEQFGMWRSYAGIFFDIPMFNLWIKTRSVTFEKYTKRI